jgi:autotransporter translocation and assembly factor TamB
VTTTGKLSLPEIGRVIPALAGYELHPELSVKADGPLDRMLLDVDVRSEAGEVQGIVTADFKRPGFGIEGDVDVARLDLAPILRNRGQRSDITGHAKLDLEFPDKPGVPLTQQWRGSFAFSGPRVLAYGYDVKNVRVTGTLAGRRIQLDGRGAAYGGTATARGLVVTPAGRSPATYDLRGSANGINLRDLPASVGAPNVATNLSLSQYHVRGQGRAVSGTATLNQSTVEGATLADGTAVNFDVSPSTITYSARGTMANLNVERIGQAFQLDAFAKPIYTSNLTGTFDVEGSVPRSPAARRPKDSAIARMTLEASGTLKNSEIFGGRVPELAYDTRVADGTLSGKANGQIEGLDPSRILDRQDLAGRVTGTVNADFSIANLGSERASTLEGVTVTAKGSLRDSEIHGGRLPALDYETSIADRALSAKVNGQFESFDPARVFSRPRLEGDVAGTIDASFSIANLGEPVTTDAITASGRLALKSSTVGGLRIDAAKVDGSYAKSLADVKELTLEGPDVKANASGRVALDTTGTSNLKYHVEAVNLPELARLAGQQDVGGSAILDGTITGNRSSLAIGGTLAASNLAYKNNNALDLDSTYTVTVPDLQMARARVEATTTGSFLKIGALKINALTAKTTYADQRVEFTTNVKEETREFDASGQLILHTDHQELHLPALAIRAKGIEWRMAQGGEATIKYGQDRVQLENVRLVSADQSLDVSGTIALKGDAPSGDLDVKARNVDLQQIETLLLQNRGLAGRLTADAKVTGTVADPTIDGRLEVTNGAFQSYKYESLVADLDYMGRRVVIDATLRQAANEQVTVKGTAPVSLFRRSTAGHAAPVDGEAVDLRITSTAMDLGLVQGFTDRVANVAGTLQADVRVTGSGADPHFVGYIDIRNGAFGVPLGGVSYSGLNTRIDLTEDHVRLQEFQILDEHGAPLRVSGELAVHEKQVGEVNISLASDNFEIIDNELGDVGVDASIRVTGELRRPKVVGEVKLEAARLEVSRIMQLFYDPYATEAIPEVVSAERAAEGSGSAEAATKAALKKAEAAAAPTTMPDPEDAPPASGGFFDPLTLDVRLVIPDNLVLRGKDLRPSGHTGTALGDINLTVGGTVNLRKNPGGKVAVVGPVETVRGTYDFQGRRFELVRGGQIRFVGDEEMNPLIDIRATRLIPNTGVEATVHVTGTAKAPELELTSNPPLEESDILALIVFNRPVNELGTGERSSLAATAGGIATGFIAAPLGESIGRALDIDLFEITTSTETGDLGAGVTLGHQIGERAFLKLHQQFGERNVTEFMIEYQLAKFLRLQATAAPETVAAGNRLNQRRIERGGIDLIFFFSY